MNKNKFKKIFGIVKGIINTIKTLQKKVEQEIVDNGKARGTQELTVGDIGLD